MCVCVCVYAYTYIYSVQQNTNNDETGFILIFFFLRQALEFLFPLRPFLSLMKKLNHMPGDIYAEAGTYEI